MICALLCAGALAAPTLQDPPRLRSILPNGSVALAERVASGDELVVTLVASTRGIPEGPSEHGRRHLLEHLLAKGAGTDFDSRLESKGMFLTASTGRDSMEFTVRGPADTLDDALAALAEVVSARRFDDGELRREVEIVGEEIALAGVESKLSTAAWSQAFGTGGLNAMGSMDALRATKPGDLDPIFRELFGAERLALVAVGPAEPGPALQKLQAWLAPRTKGPAANAPGRPAGIPGRVEVIGIVGEARSAIVQGAMSPRTSWALAVGFAIATGFEDSFVVYTPSAGHGLITIGRTDSNSGLGTSIDEMSPAEVDALFPLGVLLAGLWVGGQTSDIESIALSRGQLLAQAASLRPETYLENLEAMTLANFREGFAMFRRARCVVTVGVGR